MAATRNGVRFDGDTLREAPGARSAGWFAASLVAGAGRERRDADGRRDPDASVMTTRQPNNPLHGITLEMMLRQMVDRHGWEGLARDVPINCFRVDPSITSALKYLRKAPRARKKVEEIYARVCLRRADGVPD